MSTPSAPETSVRRGPIDSCRSVAPIAAAVLWMGVYPTSFLVTLRAPVASILARLHHAAALQQVVVPARATASAGAAK